MLALSTTLRNTLPTHLDDDKHGLGERVQDLDGRLALKETGVVAGFKDIHDESADPKQHQPAWQRGVGNGSETMVCRSEDGWLDGRLVG